MRPEPELALVRRARAGDDAAFTSLVRAHQDRVYTLVRGIVRNPHDAADVTQETFIAVLRNLDQFHEGARFSTWLHRIAVRKAYDLLRRRVPEPVDPGEPGGVIERAQGRVDEIESGMLRSALIDAIATLDEGFREAVLLVDILGCSIEEAAVTLDVAPGTVKSRLFRGRATVAATLGTLGFREASNR